LVEKSYGPRAIGTFQPLEAIGLFLMIQAANQDAGSLTGDSLYLKTLFYSEPVQRSLIRSALPWF
jgi:hypothetical protein